eukprot:1062514-Prorocentrum_minimum.AAC.1
MGPRPFSSLTPPPHPPLQLRKLQQGQDAATTLKTINYLNHDHQSYPVAVDDDEEDDFIEEEEVRARACCFSFPFDSLTSPSFSICNRRA